MSNTLLHCECCDWYLMKAGHLFSDLMLLFGHQLELEACINRDPAISNNSTLGKCKLQVKVCTLDIASLRETPLQKHSGMACVLKGSHSFTCTSTRSSAVRLSHICLCLPSYTWYLFTDPGGMEGWVGLGAWLCSETVYLPKGSHPSHH